MQILAKLEKLLVATGDGIEKLSSSGRALVSAWIIGLSVLSAFVIAVMVVFLLRPHVPAFQEMTLGEYLSIMLHSSLAKLMFLLLTGFCATCFYIASLPVREFRDTGRFWFTGKAIIYSLAFYGLANLLNGVIASLFYEDSKFGAVLRFGASLICGGAAVAAAVLAISAALIFIIEILRNREMRS
ncbi:hypothetical protein D2T29_12800 [Sinirhodobacter populi]|uniref:Uncharacterized protein n=1 Tax=Paenirhodobacter populi TaxID=2306993 RepID=A0A443KCM4_9RHOB|nr:hypothetical protein [Sinirhodobacter populi]RWR30544.1 hypothetical protein D2T29_12800 [Sinirhodobacter populi]